MSNRQHGTRAKYVMDKCRCEPCTNANRTYNRDRSRNERRAELGIEDRFVAYVDCSEARDHLRWLSSIGIGKRTVHKVSGVALSSIEAIRTGQVTKARPRSVDRILAVGRHRAHDRMPVDPTPALRMLDELHNAGMSKSAIARALGHKTPALQYSPDRPMQLQTVRRIAQLHAQLLGRRAA